MLALCFLSLVLCSLVVPLHGYVRYSLDGYDWSVCNVNGSIVVPATVPGVIHLDLLRAGLIDEPYYRFNEEAYRWIVYEPHWTFTKLFTPDPSLLHHAAVELAFDGLDTVAAVFLNGQQLASSNNMFRRLTVPLGAALLLPGQNNLTVRLGSPVLHAQAYYEQYPYELPVSDPAGEVPFRNFLRKAQSDSGWDWGGGFAPSGIWKHVELRAFDEALLVDATFVAKQLRDEQWLVNVTAYLRVAPQPNGALLQATVTTKVAGAAVSATVQLPASDLSDGDDVSVVSVVSTVQSPSLWWPVGYGNATLYPLTVAYHGTRDSDSLSRSVGFRSIRVVREQIPADQPGRSMFFEVNGLPLFAKGSNLVPFDSFHPRVTAANITRMMDSAAASHQNIIRIWGGGIFQDELVYQYADQHGILIWQEFLFACAMYPVDESFLANVREEVSQAVRRLASHASLAIFGGNNENEAMLNWQQVTITNRDRYVVDEAQLYLSTVRDALVREIGNTSIEFQSSSPSNGPFTTWPYTVYWGNAYDDDYGYNYDADCSDVAVFPRSRFISEFGWQSLPSLFTWRQMSEPSDWSYRSPLSLFRQHHDGGYDQMEAGIRRYFNFPNATDSVQLFNDTIYMTQVHQSYCYSQGINHWRRIKQESPGNTMGTIYWQMNDEWQAPTWASLEYRARWKILHYTIRQVFAPNIVSGYVSPIHSPDSATLAVYLVSDTPQPQKVAVAINLRHWSTGEVLQQLTTPVYSLQALQAVSVYNTSLMAFIGSAAADCTPVTNCYVQLQWLTNNRSTGVEHNILLGSLAPAPLVDPAIHLTVHSPSRSALRRHAQSAPQPVSSVTVTVSAAAPAAWLFVETAVEGWFSDNGFVLLPNAPRTLTFTGYEPFDAAAFEASLQVRSVWDVTNRG